MADRYLVPRRLDDPELIGFWTIDEFAGNRHDPLASIDGGARYLRDMLDRFDAVHLALAAYNAGPGAVSRSRGIPNNGETPQYVRSVLGRWQAIGTYN